MATVDNQQSWLPYESYSRDCSQGFCSIYCPQWCYLLPPPPSLTTDDDDSPTTFSPLVIAIIGVVGSALLLIIYYTLVSKFCDSLSFCRRRRQHQSHHEAAGPGGNGSHHEGWHVSRANGLDEELIKKITVYRYRRGEGIVQGTDCSVCLAEFREDDSIRLLPMCGHAFHLQCIDTWLMSHSSCPLCRCNITAPAAPEPENMSSAATVAAEHEQGVAVSTEDTERIEEEEEEGQVVDVVEIGAEDVEECMGAKDCGLSAGGGSWRSSGEEQSKGGGRSRGMPCVMSPVRMKGSVSGGRPFGRQVRESTSLLPV